MKEYLHSGDCMLCPMKCYEKLGLKGDEIKKFNVEKRAISYKKGETIFKQNSYLTNYAFIRSGLLKTVVEGTNSKDIIIKLITANQFVGYTIIGTNDYYPYTAVAMKETAVCMIKRELIEELIRSNSNVSANIIAWQSEEFHYFYRKLGIVGTKNMHGRLAETLIYLAQDDLQQENIYQYLTRQEIADFTGMSIESTIKLLAEWKNDKIITSEGKTIIIIDMEMLSRLGRIG